MQPKRTMARIIVAIARSMGMGFRIIIQFHPKHWKDKPRKKWIAKAKEKEAENPSTLQRAALKKEAKLSKKEAYSI
jgi:hypothetical protein